MEIWNYALINQFILVTYDSDFNDISVLRGYPPKIVLIQTGNLRTNELAELLNRHVKDLYEFIQNEELGCLTLFN